LSANLFAALVPLGWDDRVHALYGEITAPGLLPARVVRVERSACVVATSRDRHVLAGARTLPAVGDWVAVEFADGRSTVRGVVERWSAVTREDPGGDRVQVLAANVDVVLVTTPADRPSPARVERESVIGWESGARPIVVVTKVDLDTEGYVEDLHDRLVGVDVVATSSATGEGIGALAGALQPCLTAVLLGPSGAGKSTLTNALLGTEELATATVRDRDHRGRHTTTSRQLVVVPSGGVLIDTPGLRTLGLAGTGGGIGGAFSDIAELAVGCRFTDCRHEREPGCAVVAAEETGALGPERLASYKKLQRELAFERRRTDPFARRAEQRRWKTIHKEMRGNNRPSRGDR